MDEKVDEQANAVSAALDAMVFVYSGDIDHSGIGGLLKAMQLSEDQPIRQNILVLLTTFGGDPDCAYKIATLLQSVSSKFYLCVPSRCKSAGTLIALGANEIFMTPASELGPLDVQLRRRDEIGQRRSGMVVRTALDGLAKETFKVYESVMEGIKENYGTISFEVASRVATTIATGVMEPVYAQIKPEELGNDLRDLSIATEYGNRLVERGKNGKPDSVRRLVEDYPEHGFIIDNVEASDLFNVVKPPTKEIQSLITALGKTCYVAQSPHVIERLDRNPGDKEQPHDTAAGADTGPGADAAEGSPGVDERREANGRGNRERKPKRQGKADAPDGGEQASEEK